MGCRADIALHWGLPRSPFNPCSRAPGRRFVRRAEKVGDMTEGRSQNSDPASSEDELLTSAFENARLE